MLPPHELKNKTFSKAMRGYNPVEVDEYIEFLISKYTELYRENDELERKLKATVTRLDEMKQDEDSIRSTLIDAKRAANKIKADAEERAEAIVRSAKASCNTILRDFNEKIALGREILADLQRDTFALKQELFERYSDHIRYIDKLTEGFDEDSIPEQSELRRQAVDAIKASIASTYTAPADNSAPEETEPGDSPATVTFVAPDAPAPVTDEPVIEVSDTDTVPFPGVEDQPEPPAHSYTPGDMADALAQASAESGPIEVNRSPLVEPAPKRGIKSSVEEINKAYKDTGDDVINTPDSDVGDDMSYLDFVKSVTGGNAAVNSSKDVDLDILFDDGKKKKKK